MASEPKIEVIDNAFAFSFPYNAEIISAVKERFASRWWNSPDKTWRVLCEKASPEVLEQFCKEYKFPITADLLRLATGSVEDAVIRLLTGSVLFDGTRIQLRTSKYDEQVVLRMKNIASRKWDSHISANTFTVRNIGEVLAIAKEFNFTIDESLSKILSYTGKTTLHGIDGRGLIYVEVNSPDFATASSLAGVKYSRKLGGFLFEETFLLSVMARLPEILIDESAKGLIAEFEKSKELVDLSRAVNYEASADEWQACAGMAINESRRPFPYQMAAVEYIRRVRRAIIGDDMGVGKTLTAITAIHALGGKPALIVCPATAKENWRREIKAWIPNASVDIISGTTPIQATLGGRADFTIINYDILHAHQNSFSEMKALVCDESHRIKSILTRRTKAALAVSASMPSYALRLNMTGTATPNRAEELISQLEVIGVMDKFGTKSAFKNKYVAGDSLVELNNKLRQTCYVQRTLRDVAEYLPSLTYTIFSMQGSTEGMREYRKCEADLIEWIRRNEREKRQRDGAGFGEAQRQANIKAERAMRAEALVRIGKLRQLSANAKMGEVASFIDEMAEAQEKLITFAYHTKIVDAITESFSNGLTINGAIDVKDRQGMVDKFQDKPNEMVLSLQFPTASEALNITAAHNLLFIELPWNWAMLSQSVARSFRTGQTFPVTAHIPIIPDTIDERMWEIIEKKKVNTEMIQNGLAIDEAQDEQSTQTELINFFTKMAIND